MHQILRSRRTIHDYRPKAINWDDVERAIQAAMLAPNHGCTWPWRFTRVGPVGRRALADLYVRLKREAAVAPLRDVVIDRYRAKVSNPAECLIVSQVLCDDPMRSREDYAAVAAALQNLMLSLHADGLGSKWTTGGMTRHAETYALCGVDSAVEEIVGFVWVGHPARVPKTPERPPLSDVLRTLP